MAVIVNTNLAGLTVTYNGVQFGGADSAYQSTPPLYSLQGELVYDDSGRAIKYVRYVLNVRCIFYEDSETLMAANMNTIRELLTAPGKILSIAGLGTGFGTITNDVDYGPKPLSPIGMMPLGQLGWELSWSVEFHISECASPGVSELAFIAFNFETTWQNDFEGLCTRTISGHLEIAMKRSGINGKTPKHVVDEVRENVNIIIPPGYRRTSNIWRENLSKNRLDFIVVDEPLPGDPYPEHFIKADGEITFESGNGQPGGGGFASASISLSMSLRVAPDKPRNLAGLTFLTAAIGKQLAMQAALPAGGTVVPTHLRISAGKFDRARETNAVMSWHMTKCLNDMIKAAGLWEPVKVGVNPLTYTAWSTSISNLWGNRGLTGSGILGLRSSNTEAVIIDLCDNVTEMVIGGTTSQGASPVPAAEFIFTCPTIPPDGGWIHHQIEIRVLRKDEQTWHRKAITYPEGAAGQGQGTPPAYQTGSDQEPDVEYQGQPVIYIGLYFRGVRFIDDPMQVNTKLKMPVIKTVAGLPAVFVKEEIDGPRWMGDTLVCPTYTLQGWRVYRIKGYISTVKQQESLTSCAAPNGDKEQY